MSNVNDILSSIMLGRLVAERARADHLSRALSEVEDLVRELQPAPEAVTVERCNAADLADLEAMRDLLGGADFDPTPDGLRWLLESYKDRRGDISDLERERAALAGDVTALRAKIAALTPGPWRTVAEEAPPIGEWIGVVSSNGDYTHASWLSDKQPIDWLRCWRRLPAGLLTPPTDAAPAVTP